MPSPEKAYFRLAKTSAGSSDMAADGSGTPLHFDLTNDRRSRLSLNRCNITLLDSGITPVKFGGLTALTAGTGLLVRVVNASAETLFDFLNGGEITANYGWGQLAGTDAPIVDAVGGDYLPIRWTLDRAFNGRRPLYLDYGEALRFTVRADLTGLQVFYIMGQGEFG